MKEYTITEFDDGGEDPFQDQYGNTWCTVVFAGIQEPIKWVLKSPSSVSVGDKVVGEVKTEKSRKGSDYLRFRKANKDQLEAFGGSTGGSTPSAPQQPEWLDKQSEIKAEWAIGQAVQLINGQEEKPEEVFKAVEDYAVELFNMVDVVRSNNLSTIEKVFGEDTEVIQ